MNVVTNLIVCGLFQVTLVALTGLTIVGVMGRWSRASFDRISTWTMYLILGLTFLTALPIPSWLERTPSEAESSNIDSGVETDSTPAMSGIPAVVPIEAKPSLSFRELLIASLDGLTQEPVAAENQANVPGVKSSDTNVSDSTTGSVTRWFVLIVAVAFGIGFIRLAGGLWGVHCLVQTSRPMQNGPLRELLDVLCAEMHCGRTVTIRECSQLTSAATVGYRSPVILISSQWRTWRDDQLRCVVAHELAHIVRGDFATTIVAQFGLLLHFYHPLVHCLVRQLRLEQELAADALAASVTGGPQSYLNSIGEIALLQSRDLVSWPAHSFLPTRTTFLRRIEMLRDVRRLTKTTIPVLRGVSLCGLLAVAFIAAGVRQPGTVLAIADGGQLASLGRPASPETGNNQQDRIHSKYVPVDAVGVIAIRPALLMPMLDQLVNPVDGSNGTTTVLSEHEAVLLELFRSVEQATVVVGSLDPQGADPLAFLVEFKDQASRDKAAEFWTGDFVYRKESLLLAQIDVSDQMTRYFPDNRSMIFGSRDVVAKMILAGPEPMVKLISNDEWKQATGSTIAMAVDTIAIRQVLQHVPPDPIAGLMSPLWLKADRHIASINFEGAFKLKVHSESADVDSAINLEAAEKAAVSMLRGMVTNMKTATPASQKDGTQLLSKLLETATVRREDFSVVMSLEGDGNGASQMFRTLVMPAVLQVREAAARAQQVNNLKQIMLALHNYESAYGHLPPAVFTDPNTGVARSWRVEILPFIEQEQLYNEYRKDQPWDSENNLKVLNRMPAVFRHPGQPKSVTSTAFFAAYGAGLAMSPGDNDGRKLAEFTDGLSNTIVIVEARREIPWTKPDDILLDLNSDSLPELGGYFKGGWHAAFADGHVRFISTSINSEMLRSLLTIGGGEQIGAL